MSDGGVDDAGDGWECTTDPNYLDGSVAALPLRAEQDAGPVPTDVPPMTGFDRLVFHGDGEVDGIMRSPGDTFAFTLDTVAGYGTSGTTNDYVVLDDSLVRPFVGGVEHASLAHMFVGRFSSIDFEVRGVPPGLHKMTLIRTIRDPSIPVGTVYRGDVLTPGAIFAVTLVRDEAVWPDLAFAEGTPGPVPVQFWQRDVRQDSPTVPLHGGPDASGMVSLRLGICSTPEHPMACSSLSIWSGFTLFLDGAPYRAASRDVVTASVTPTECVFVGMNVGPLPVDGAPHRLDVVHLSGLRSPTFLELGGPLSPYGSGAYTSVGITW